MRSRSIAILLLTCVTTPLMAQGTPKAEKPAATTAETQAASDPLPRPTNAALFFWKAWSIQPPTLLETVDGEFNGRDLAWTPSSDVSRVLADAQPFILAVLHASELPQCDFGIEYSLGRDMDIGHLDKLRGTARILVSDTRRLQAEGQMDDAVRRVVALYNMSALVRSDHLTQSSSTSLGFARMASDELRRMCGANVLNAEQRETLKKAADSLSGKDPFQFADAIRREGDVTYHYLTSRFTGPNAGPDLLATVTIGGEPEPVVTAISHMDGAALKAEAAQARDYYRQVADAWAADDAMAQLAALEEKIITSKFGSVAVLVCPGLRSASANTTQQLAMIREARAMLDAAPATPAPMHGPVPPQDSSPKSPQEGPK